MDDFPLPIRLIELIPRAGVFEVKLELSIGYIPNTRVTGRHSFKTPVIWAGPNVRFLVMPRNLTKSRDLIGGLIEIDGSPEVLRVAHVDWYLGDGTLGLFVAPEAT
jgi:hypothetical protein